MNAVMRKFTLFVAAALVAACAALFCAPVQAHAETTTAGWTVTFGSDMKMTSDYAQQKASVDEALGNLLPGDTFIITVHLDNKSSLRTAWYMSSNAIKTLEQGSQASNGAYTYKLTYGGEEIYSSNTVGGDESSGFMEISNATGEWFWLGYIDAGKSNDVQIQMSLDGETQNNSYMSTVGKLAVSFAVEFNDGTGRRVVQEQQENTTTVQQGSDMPQTGDTMWAVILFAVVGACAAACAAGLAKRKGRGKGSDPR